MEKIMVEVDDDMFKKLVYQKHGYATGKKKDTEPYPEGPELSRPYKEKKIPRMIDGELYWGIKNDTEITFKRRTKC